MDFLTTVCFTGHRPPKIGGYNPYSRLRLGISSVLRLAIAEALRRGYKTFTTGMAQGTDQDAAEAVLEFKNVYPHEGIKLVAAVPFLGQEERWPYETRQHYAELLEQADDVVYICEPGYAGWKMQKRNEWMIDRSSLIIAVFDGSAGGTANCIQYAREKQPARTFLAIDPRRVAGGDLTVREL